jgi:aquaporin Z
VSEHAEDPPEHKAEKPPEPTMAVRLAAEALGTFALVFVAAGADAMAKLSGGEVTPLARAVAPGMLVMALIYAIGDRAGAHFNPVVTLGFTLRGLFPPRWVVPYVVVQLVGAAIAGLVLAALFGPAAAEGVSRPHIDPAVAVSLEAILTAILLTVILGTADRYQLIGSNAAIAVGATIALCGLIALPIEGASMNPARSFGPAVATGNVADLWIYVAGPLIGSLVAVLIAFGLHGAPPRGHKPKEAAMGDDPGTGRP